MIHSHVRKGLAAFHPRNDLPAELQNRVSFAEKPENIGGWEGLIDQYGPIIVSGMLGAASWGRLPVVGTKLGVNHFIVIVGAEVGEEDGGGRLLYKDPLQGNRLREHSFAEMNSRIDPWLYYLTIANANALLTQLGAA